MASHSPAHQPAQTRPAEFKSVTSAQRSALGSVVARPNQVLQRSIGNQALSRLLQTHAVQPKLTVSDPDDEYEREADRVADQVMRMPDPEGVGAFSVANSGMVQRKCACDTAGGKACECNAGD